MQKRILILAASLALLPAMAVAEAVHAPEKEKAACAHKVVSDPRVPIVFGSLWEAEDKPTVRIPQPRHR